MDSLTQIVLGSAVAYAVAGKQSPKVALLAGAVVATLPDLDVLFSNANPLLDTVYHRTWSHSLIVQTAIAPLLALFAFRVVRRLHYFKWLGLVWLCLVTHSLLDSATIYGTGLFWPLAVPTIMQGALFIIDPLYTLPLLFSVVLAWFCVSNGRAKKAIYWGLGLSTVYLLWALGVQHLMQLRFKDNLVSQGISTDSIFVTPTPFNTLLWRVVAIDGGQYYEGFTSIFDRQPIKLKPYSRGLAYNTALESFKSVSLYQDFSHDFYAIKKQNEDIIIQDLRMGMGQHLVFQFVVAKLTAGKIKQVEPILKPRLDIPKGFFKTLLARIKNEKIKLID